MHFLFNLVIDEDLSVLSVTETWLTESCSSSFVEIPEFHFHRGDVVGEVRKHGAGLYVHHTLRHIKVEVSISNVVVVHLIDYDVYVMSVYRPPSYATEANHVLVAFLRTFSVGRELVILGDFNLPSLKWSEATVFDSYISPNDRLFYDCFVDCGLVQWVDFATFFPSGNILDLILTSDQDRVGEVFSCPPLPGCHHCPVICNLVFQFRSDDVNVQSRKLAWSKADFTKISAYLVEVDWDTAFVELDIGECYRLFIGIIEDCINRYVPYKEAPKSGKWLVVPPRSLILRRKTLWNAFKSCRSRHGRVHPETVMLENEYFMINQTYRNFARFKQSEYEQRLIDLLPDAPKIFHSYLRQRKTGCPSVGPLKLADGSLSYENVDMSEEFVSAFSSVFVSHAPVDPHPFQASHGCMTNLEVTYEKVFEILETLSVSSSAGPDGVHPALLRNCAAVLALPLYFLICKSLEDLPIKQDLPLQQEWSGDLQGLFPFSSLGLSLVL